MSSNSNDQGDPHADSMSGAQALAAAVSETDNHSGRHDVTKAIHAHGHEHSWLAKLIPGAEKLTVKFHAGNFVAVRDKTKPPGTEKIFESMPIYVRIGMHLLFYGKEQVKLLEHQHKLEAVLKEQSLKEGRIYDSPESVHSIPSFIQTYKINVDELLEPDISKYKNFNEFFSRKLKPDARPVENPAPDAFCSAADSRVTVYESVSEAQKFWIKGDEFTLKKLLYGADQSNMDPSLPLEDASLAIFRLAPSDYHRFHSPVDAKVIGDPRTIDGHYFTVNPEAVNEPNLDVFTANKRSIIPLELGTGEKMAFVAVGALLVGSIGWTRKAGEEVHRGEELGFFAYGGSTCIAVFPKGTIKFDDDLLTNSRNSLETCLKVGWSLGVRPGQA